MNPSSKITRMSTGDMFRARLAEQRFEGVPLAEIRMERKHKGGFDTRLTKKFGEMNGMAHLLTAAEVLHVDIYPRENPDFRVVLADGAVVYVEYARVESEDQRRASNIVHQMNVGLRQAIANDADLSRKFLDSGFHVIVKSVPLDKRLQEPLISDICELLRALDTASLRPKINYIPPQFAMVRQYADVFDWTPPGTILHIVDPNHPRQQKVGELPLASRKVRSVLGDPTGKVDVLIVQDGFAFTPEDQVPIVRGLLKDKIDKAKGYEGSPLWIALFQRERLNSPTRCLDALQKETLDLGPFEKLIIGNDEGVLIISS